ncbi:hypothetical protein ACUODF_55505, partial [Escherichia coli]
PQEKAVQQPIKAEEKPGRNDPCPCGRVVTRSGVIR